MSLLISWGEIVAFQTYRLYFSGTGQNSGTRGGRARPLCFPFFCRVSHSVPHPQARRRWSPRSWSLAAVSPGCSGLLPVPSWDRHPRPTWPCQRSPKCSASRLLIEELNSRVLLGN